jgi:hypothetical protein
MALVDRLLALARRQQQVSARRDATFSFFLFLSSLCLFVFLSFLASLVRAVGRASVSELVQTHGCMQVLSRNGTLCPSLEADLQSLELACCHAAKTGGSAQ